MDDFDAAWDVLAEQGVCDDRGSAEYRRLRGEWERDARLYLALQFIRNNANNPPPDKRAPPYSDAAK